MSSILWSAPVPPTKHPHNMMLPPPCFVIRMVFFGLQTLFLPNITMVIMAKQLHFGSSDQRTFHQKVRPLPPCPVAKCSLAFLWWFWSNGFWCPEEPFWLCRYRTPFTKLWCLQAFANCSQGWTTSYGVVSIILILADLWCQVVPKSIATPPIDSNNVNNNEYQRFLKPWDNFLEFSKLCNPLSFLHAFLSLWHISANNISTWLWELKEINFSLSVIPKNVSVIFLKTVCLYAHFISTSHQQAMARCAQYQPDMYQLACCILLCLSWWYSASLVKITFLCEP